MVFINGNVYGNSRSNRARFRTELANGKEKMNVERKPIYCVMEEKRKAGREVSLRGCAEGDE